MNQGYNQTKVISQAIDCFGTKDMKPLQLKIFLKVTQL